MKEDVRFRWMMLIVLGTTLSLALPALAEGPEPNDVLFQDGFEAWQDANQRVESTWATWASEACTIEGEGVCQTPEYKQANPVGAYPERVHSGSNAQQYFSFFAGHNAGVWKQFDVSPGAIIEIHAWGMAWSTASDDGHDYDGAQDVRMRIGVDPHGGTSPTAPSVVWGESGNPPNVWQEVPSVEVTAGPEGRITVFLGSDPKWPLKHNDIYWDDVYALYLGQGAPALPTVEATSGGTPPESFRSAPVSPPDPILDGLVGGDLPAGTGGAEIWAVSLSAVGLALVMGLTARRERVR